MHNKWIQWTVGLFGKIRRSHVEGGFYGGGFYGGGFYGEGRGEERVW